MLELEFKIKPRYIAIYSFQYKRGIVSNKLKNKIWDKNKNFFLYLAGKNYDRVLYGFDRCERFEEEWKDLMKEEEIKKIIKETEEFKEKIEKDWNENKEKALKLIEKLSGLKLPDKKIKVYLTNPKQKNGSWHREIESITWGPRDKYPLYSIKYFCHEIMHSLAPRGRVMHAIIELIDEKIHEELTGKKIIDGHDYLKEIKEEIRPKWEKYLKEKTHKNVIELSEDIKSEKK